MDGEGLADAAAANPFRLPRLHPGIASVQRPPPQHVWHLVKRVIEPILGRRLHPHVFRYSYATHIYEESGDLPLPQHLLGHVSIRTTAACAHVTPRRERLIEFLGERGGQRKPVRPSAGPE